MDFHHKSRMLGLDARYEIRIVQEFNWDWVETVSNPQFTVRFPIDSSLLARFWLMNRTAIVK